MYKKYLNKTALMIILVLVSSVVLSCATQTAGRRARGGDDADYKRLGISKSKIAVWEDGLRTSGGEGTFEWWYFDAKMQNGSTIVIVFYTKNILDINKPLTPYISVTMSDPDGKQIYSHMYEGDRDDCSFSKEQCDVRIGQNTVKGDLHNYVMHIDFEDIKADLEFRGTIPAWRPQTGHSFFVNGSEETFFAWLPSIPQGEVNGSLTVEGETQSVKGSCYHDHNWGNALMSDQMHDWYWGRAEVGPYTVISAWITVAEEFGGGAGATFGLWRNGKLIAEDGKFVTCQLEDVYTDSNTGKPVANKITYDYNDSKKHYRVIYEREEDIENVEFISKLSGLKYLVAKLIGFDGAYLRFSGKVTIQELKGSKVIRSATEESAVWELMYLGHAPETK